jgi:hypothetical protein
MLLKVTNTIPGIERGLEACEFFIARSGFRLGTSSANSISWRNSVEKWQVDMLGPKKLELRLPRKGGGEVVHDDVVIVVWTMLV